MERITGLINAPFTPFDINGNVDFKPIESYAAMLKKNGISGVFVNGSTGEGSTLTDSERMELAQKWVDVAPKDFKVIVHVGGCGLRSGCILAEHAQKIGAWGVGAMPMSFPKIGRIEELFSYCKSICDAAPKIPFYYYHIPAFSSTILPMVELLKAVDGKIPNFAGIKYTYENMYEYNQCRLYGNGKFDILHGQDETYLPSLAQGGAKGCICGTTNYNAREQIEIGKAWDRGDIETARAKQNFSQAVINAICRYRGNIVAGKRIMKMMGMDLGPNRLPFQNMTDAEEKSLKAELDSINFFSRCNIL